MIRDIYVTNYYYHRPRMGVVRIIALTTLFFWRELWHPTILSWNPCNRID